MSRVVDGGADPEPLFHHLYDDCAGIAADMGTTGAMKTSAAVTSIIDAASLETKLSTQDLATLTEHFSALSPDSDVQELKRVLPDHPLVVALSIDSSASKEDLVALLEQMSVLHIDDDDISALSFLSKKQKGPLETGVQAMLSSLDARIDNEIASSGPGIKADIKRYEILSNRLELDGELLSSEQGELDVLRDKVNDYLIPSYKIIVAPRVEKTLQAIFKGMDISDTVLKPMEAISDKVVGAYPPCKKRDFVRMASSHTFDASWRDRMAPKLFERIKYTQARGAEAIAEVAKIWPSDLRLVQKMKAEAEDKLSGVSSTEERDCLGRIIKRADKNIASIGKGEYVRLPRYYHGCGGHAATMNSILGSSIRSMDASYGKGAYLSTRTEDDYGPIYLALSEHDIDYLPLGEEGDHAGQANMANDKQTADDSSGQAVWRAVKRSIPIGVSGEDTPRVAYVIVAEGGSDNLTVGGIKQSLEAKGFNSLQVLSRHEAELERKILEKIRGVSEPKEWAVKWKEREAKAEASRLNPAVSRMLALARARAEAETDSDDSDSDWDD